MDGRVHLDGARDREDISEGVAFTLGSERWVESSLEMREEKHVQRSGNGNRLAKGTGSRSVRQHGVSTATGCVEAWSTGKAKSQGV